jgi:hypothetical protein
VSIVICGENLMKEKIMNVRNMKYYTYKVEYEMLEFGEFVEKTHICEALNKLGAINHLLCCSEVSHIYSVSKMKKIIVYSYENI